MTAYVVVALTASECEEYPGTRCVMSVHGPFPTREAAKEKAGELPEWASPHIMPLDGLPLVVLTCPNSASQAALAAWMQSGSAMSDFWRWAGLNGCQV